MEEYTHFFSLVPEKGFGRSKVASEDKKLELRLGPPGDHFLSYKNISTTADGCKRHRTEEAKIGEGNSWFTSTPSHEKQCKKFSFYEGTGNDDKVLFSSSSEKQKEIQHPNKTSSSPSSSYVDCCSKVVELQCLENKKPCCAGPATVNASFPAITTDGTISPNKRVAAAPVVGWPPIRSFRKNIAGSTNSKLVGAAATNENNAPDKTPTEGCTKPAISFRNNDLFVKINMEGVPIGRKINLNAYDSYDKLSVAIDQLFRGLLAAQRETCDGGNTKKTVDGKANGNAGSSSESGERGEYTLVYEDSEGDRILAGDVPWRMFVSTAKRLRVLKSTEISNRRLSVGSSEQDKTPLSSLVEIGR